MSPFSFCPVYFQNDLYKCLTEGLSLGKEVSLIACVLLAIAIPYLLGSLNFGIILSRIFFHEDIRDYGSGNAGSTNMLRTYGKKAAALTLVCDMLKAALAVLVGALFLNPATRVTPVDGIAIASLFVVLGHCFPCFYRFRGGKGVATLGMVILITRPLIFVLVFFVFVVLVAGTRFISLGSIISALLFPVLLNRLDTAYPMGWFQLMAVLMAFLVLFMHRANIKRLLEGKESKLSFGKKKKTEPEKNSDHK
ncbi:MAG: glycerol-3-phosphate 1-O-acyltransferase PlsY [Clostridia bacterium]|nr:glycerol-3-phosphate 1-O-acyltransferase PlsY [Clostridia bacterium]